MADVPPTQTTGAGTSDRRVSRLGALALLLFALAVISTAWAWYDYGRSNRAIDRNVATIIGLERMLSTLKDLETGQRGFLLTGDETYLAPYTDALPKLDSDLQDLQGADIDMAVLRRLVAERVDSARQAVEVFRQGGLDAVRERLRKGVGKAAMGAVRQYVADQQAAADSRIEALNQHEAETGWPLALIASISTAASFALLVVLANRRRREQRAAAALLEGVLENAPVGLGLLDNALRVRHMNRALSTMSDRALSANVGMSIWAVVPHLRDALESRLGQVVDGGRSVANVDIQAGSNLRQDQTRDYQVSFYPLRSTSGRKRIEGAGMVVSDITARKRMERWLRDSEERFRTLTEASTDIVWTTDAEGRFDKPQQSWAEFTGRDPSSLQGLGYLSCVHPDDLVAGQQLWGQAMQNRSRFATEHRLQRADGEWRHMAVSVAPILDEEGTVREWVGTHTDITDRIVAGRELADAKEAAEAANRAKSVFLANMSHELRTPLSAVIGYSEMIEEEMEDAGQTALITDVGKIKANARHLLSLINDVLDLSKIEANRMDTFAEDVDVSALVLDIVSTTEPLARQKRNRLETELGGNLGAMHTDLVKLRQCLFNLLSNASKFTEDGVITVSVSRETAPDPTSGSAADWLVFGVKDTGIGMTPEQLGRLFERFSQADETTTRKFGGTGLGLAITRAFSRLLGGDIDVESSAGEGTTFTITLPAIMPAAAEQSVEASAAAVSDRAPGDRNVVLVVDDDAGQRDLMIRFLERQGFVACTAVDGAKGLELARTLRPRAILLDVMMPNMDGWSVLSALKNDPELAHIPVVMITFVDDKGLSAALGAADHVNKPVNWSRLAAVMDRLKGAHGDILVVDDDPEVRARVRHTLERSGWTVRDAADGKEALQSVVQSPPRAILLDLTMPVMDGFTFLHELRNRPGCNDIPVIVFTARDISAADRAQLKDADKILSKTMSLRDLAGELRALAPPGAGAEAS